jgi:hypothetical protein
MAAGPTNPLLRAAGIVVTRRKPGHFVALTKDGRIDAYLAQGGAKLPDALERRSSIIVNNVSKGSNDGTTPLLPNLGIKSIDPYEIAIAMPAADGESVVSEAERNAWHMYRIAYNVTLTVTPFTVTGIVLLMASQDPTGLTERGSELFVAVFAPTVEIGGVTLADTPTDTILVNRAHIRGVKASRR